MAKILRRVYAPRPTFSVFPARFARLAQIDCFAMHSTRQSGACRTELHSELHGPKLRGTSRVQSGGNLRGFELHNSFALYIICGFRSDDGSAQVCRIKRKKENPANYIFGPGTGKDGYFVADNAVYYFLSFSITTDELILKINFHFL